MISAMTVRSFRSEIERELVIDILPFWMEKTVDRIHGGFYGEVSYDLAVKPEAVKCCILNSRILWTFSAAYRLLGDEQYRETADRAFDYLVTNFWDLQYSGLSFEVDYRGKVVNPRKQVYNLVFGIYGFSEYYRATANREALEKAIELFRLIEKYCHDPKYQGYFEARARDWSPIEDFRLSPVDLNEKKSMNTHLHIMEAYTNLLRVWGDEDLRKALRHVIEVMLAHIVNPENGHFKMFFDDEWNAKADIISYGHDIEGSWLLLEAAEVCGETDLTERVTDIALKMAETVYCEGIDAEYGGLFNEVKKGSPPDYQKIWWPQCEAIIGFFNAYQLTGREYFLEAAIGMWEFVKTHLLDKDHGEWFYSVSRDGRPLGDYYKVGAWKCPYHNGRTCLEIMTRIQK